MPKPDVSPLAGYPHGRVPRRVREEQLLELGEELFAQRGYEGMTMDELAARAGVTKPVIYAIVRSKDELYRRCFERSANELRAAVSAAGRDHLGDLEGLLAAGNLAFFRFIASHAGAFAMLFAEHAGGRHARYVDALRARQAQLLVDVLSAYMSRAGRSVDRRRLELAGQAVNGAAEALAHWWRGHPETTPEELAAELTRLLLPGLQELLGTDARTGETSASAG